MRCSFGVGSPARTKRDTNDVGMTSSRCARAPTVGVVGAPRTSSSQKRLLPGESGPSVASTGVRMAVARSNCHSVLGARASGARSWDRRDHRRVSVDLLRQVRGVKVFDCSPQSSKCAQTRQAERVRRRRLRASAGGSRQQTSQNNQKTTQRAVAHGRFLSVEGRLQHTLRNPGGAKWSGVCVSAGSRITTLRFEESRQASVALGALAETEPRDVSSQGAQENPERRRELRFLDTGPEQTHSPPSNSPGFWWPMGSMSR